MNESSATAKLWQEVERIELLGSSSSIGLSNTDASGSSASG